MVDGYDELARRLPPVVLDLGAGGGRMTVPLALRGHDVVAVEPTPGMRAALMARLADNPASLERVTVVPTSAEDLDLPGVQVGLALVLGVAQHFPDAGRAVFDLVRRQLHPAGLLVVTAFAAEVDEVAEREVSRRRLGCTELVTSVQREVLSADLLRHTYRFRLIDPRGVLWEDLSVTERRPQHPAELRAALTAAGFTLVEEEPCNDWSLGPIGTRLICRLTTRQSARCAPQRGAARAAARRHAPLRSRRRTLATARWTTPSCAATASGRGQAADQVPVASTAMTTAKRKPGSSGPAGRPGATARWP